MEMEKRGWREGGGREDRGGGLEVEGGRGRGSHVE